MSIKTWIVSLDHFVPFRCIIPRYKFFDSVSNTKLHSYYFSLWWIYFDFYNMLMLNYIFLKLSTNKLYKNIFSHTFLTTTVNTMIYILLFYIFFCLCTCCTKWKWKCTMTKYLLVLNTVVYKNYLYFQNKNKKKSNTDEINNFSCAIFVQIVLIVRMAFTWIRRACKYFIFGYHCFWNIPFWGSF